MTFEGHPAKRPDRAEVVYVIDVYSRSMPSSMTTIRVGRDTRDRLAALAAAHGRSIGAELDTLLDDLAWRGIEAGYLQLADVDEVSRYRSEADAWAAAGLDDLAASAADEYPEYNGKGQ